MTSSAHENEATLIHEPAEPCLLQAETPWLKAFPVWSVSRRLTKVT